MRINTDMSRLRERGICENPMSRDFFRDAFNRAADDFGCNADYITVPVYSEQAVCGGYEIIGYRKEYI